MSTPKNSNPLSKGSNRSVVESKSFIAPEKEITMTFAEGPEALLEAQLRLTDQYSNPLEALVRETVSNALDAVIAKAGEGDYAKLPKGSVKISLLKDPSSETSYIFKVEDEGTGMSEETLTQNYARYNASSKTTDMKVQGAKGLGAKVPFAYQDRFTGITTKDSVSISFTAVKSKEGFKLLIDSIIEDSPLNDGTSLIVSINNKRDALVIAETIAFHYSPFTSYYPYEISLDEELAKEVKSSSPIGYYETYSRRMKDHNRLKFISDKVLLHEETGLTGKLFVNLPEEHIFGSSDKYYRRLFERLHDPDLMDFGILSSGWLYSLEPDDGTQSSLPFFILEIKPGLLDFPSSRDKLIENDRFRSLMNTVRKDLLESPDNFTEFLEQILRRAKEGKKQQLHCELYDFIEGYPRESAFKEAVKEILGKSGELRDVQDELTKFYAYAQLRVEGKKINTRGYSREVTYNPLYAFELHNESKGFSNFSTSIIEKESSGEKALFAKHLSMAGNYKHESYTFLVENTTEDLYKSIFKVKKNLLRHLMEKEGFTEDDDCNLIFVESSSKLSDYTKKMLEDTSTKFSTVDCSELLEGAKENKRAEERERRARSKASASSEASNATDDFATEIERVGSTILSYLVRTKEKEGLLVTEVDIRENSEKNILLKDSVKKVVVSPVRSQGRIAEGTEIYAHLINKGLIDSSDEIAVIGLVKFKTFELMEDKENRLLFVKGSAKSSSKTVEDFKKKHLIDLDETKNEYGIISRKDIFDKADWERLAKSFALADVKASRGYCPTFEAESYLGKEFIEKYYSGLMNSNGIYSTPGYSEIYYKDRAKILEKLIKAKDTPKNIKESAKELLEAINYKGLSNVYYDRASLEIEDPEEFKAVMKFLTKRKKQETAPVRLKV